MGEWKTYRLGEICKNVCSGGTPKSTEPSYYGGNIPWLNTKEVNFCRIDKTEKTITDSGFQNSSTKWVEKNSVIVAMYGATAAKVAVNMIPLTTNQACCNLTIDPNLADFRFVYFYLCYKYTSLAALANGGAQQNLNAQRIKDFYITLPPLEEQKRIADILWSLDDKIELNRRINANLEAQAQALFRSWFVDFEPFRDGPFVDSELGKIPQGWKVLLFSDFCEHSTQKVEDRTVTEYSVTNSGMFPREQKYTKQLSQNISKDKLIRKRDLVFGMSREILNWGIMKNDQEGGVSAAYTIYHIKDEIDSTYLENYITFHKPYFKDLIKPAAREGQGIDKKIFENKILYYPPQNVLNNFFAIYNTLITNNQNEEIKTLSALRDTLLPKLMAGEINVE